MTATEDQEKLELKRLEVSNSKEQQNQQQLLQTAQIIQQVTSPHTPQEYFAGPVPTVPPVSLPTLPSLQVTSAGVQIQADIAQSQVLKARLYQEGYRDGLQLRQQQIIHDTFQSQLLLQSSQISKSFILFKYTSVRARACCILTCGIYMYVN